MFLVIICFSNRWNISFSEAYRYCVEQKSSTPIGKINILLLFLFTFYTSRGTALIS